MRQKETAAPGEGGGNDDQRRSENIISNSGPQRSRISFVALGELPVPPPRREIVAGLLAAGEVALLAGDPGAGKSALAVLLAACVTSGNAFCGREVERGSVLYAALERRAQTAARLWAAQSHELRTHILDAPTLALTEDAEPLAEAVRAMQAPPRLLIIDTLARAMPGIEENSATEMGRVAAALAMVQAAMPDGAIVLVHHLAKGISGKRSARGSTALLGAVDLELQVEVNGAVRTATVTKANSIAEGAQIAFQILDEDGTALAAPCTLADLRRQRGRELRDLNAEKAAEKLARAKALHAALPSSFSRKEAIDHASDAGLLDGVKAASRRVVVTRLLDRLAEEGAVEQVGPDLWQTRTDVRATVCSPPLPPVVGEHT